MLLEKKTGEAPDASKKEPRELPRPEMRPEKSREGLQEGTRGPRGAPEARQAILGDKKPLWGPPGDPPRGSSHGTDLVLFDMIRLHLPHRKTAAIPIVQMMLSSKTIKFLK